MDALKDLGFVPTKQDDHELADLGFIPHEQEGNPRAIPMESPEEATRVARENTIDTLRGLTQGATLGGADEIGGGFAAILDKLQATAHNAGLADESASQVNARLKAQGIHGDVGPTDMGEVYRQAQQDTLKGFKDSEARSPWLYGAGQLGGMVATSGPLGGITKGALGLKALPQSAGLLSKAARAVTIAAPEGALMGGLSSDKGALIDSTPEEKLQLLKDIGYGTATASALGAGVSLAAHGIPLLGQKAGSYWNKKIEDVPFLKQGELARERLRTTRKGFSGEANRRDIRAGTNAAVEGIISGLEEGRGTLGNELESSLTNSNAAFSPSNAPNVETSLDQVLGDVAQRPGLVKGGQAQELTDLITKFKSGQLSAKELYDLRSILKKNFSTTDEVFGNNIKNAAGQVRSALNTIPEFNAANTKFNKFAEAGSETILNKGATPDFRRYYQSDKAAPVNDLYKTLKTSVERYGRPGTSADSSKELIDSLKEGLSGFETKHPGEIQRLTGQSVEDITKNLEKQGNLEAVRRSIVSERAEGTPIEAIMGLFSPKAGYFRLKGAQGYIEGSGVVRAGRSYYNMGKQQASDLANKLLSIPSSTQYGQSLQQAIQNNDIFKQNAIIFSLQQNPLIGPMLNGEGE